MTKNQLYVKLDTLKLCAMVSQELYEVFKESSPDVAKTVEQLGQKTARELSLILGEVDFETLECDGKD